MRDRIVEYPNRYLMVPAGDEMVDLLPVPGTVTQAGTPLNKASLLTDQTAAALGLTGTDPTVNDALAALGGMVQKDAKIASGSYVGTGTYGAGSPCSLTFGFQPRLVVVALQSTNAGALLVMAYPASLSPKFDVQSQTAGGTYINDGYYGMRVSWSGTKVSWYHANTAGQQMNDSGSTYYYTAIGVES